MAKKINKLNQTTENPELKQNKNTQTKKVSFEKIKEALSKRNTAPKLKIVQWPPGCLLWMTLFDQSPEVQRISWLWFVILAEIKGTPPLAIPYGIAIDKNKPNIDGNDIVVPGRIIKMPEDEQSPLAKEKFIFLPKDTQVKIRYNQDTWSGDIEILSYPFDIVEDQNKEKISEEKEWIKSGETTINIVSKVVSELNKTFMTLENHKQGFIHWSTNKEIEKIRDKLAKTMEGLKTMSNKTYVKKATKDIQNSAEYQRVQAYELEETERKKWLEVEEETFNQEQERWLTKIVAYMKKQESCVKNISELLLRTDIKEEEKFVSIKTIIHAACKDWMFIIADNFIAQDNYQSVYRKIDRDKRPKYVKWDLNLQVTMDLVKILTKLQDNYPGILEGTWALDQIKQSIHDRRLKVEENVKNGRYNSFTRSGAIRYEDLREMLSKVSWKDAEVLNDMIAIFDSLIQQRHQDGSNSWNFTGTVLHNIALYAWEDREVLGKGLSGNVNMLKYMDEETKEQVWFSDVESGFWMNWLLSTIKSQEKEDKCFEVLENEVEGKRMTSSHFPNLKMEEYVDFLKKFLQTKKLLLKKDEDVNATEFATELHNLYQEELICKGKTKKLQEKLIVKAEARAKEVFKKLSPKAKEEYFKKVYDESRGQNHRTGLHTFKEFKKENILTVISEHSYWSSRGGIERDSQLCIYVNDCTLKSSTGYQNYRDRFESSKDNPNNQYVEVLEVKKEADIYHITARTWAGKEKTLEMTPKENYELNLEILSGITSIVKEDKKMFLEASTSKKELTQNS